MSDKSKVVVSNMIWKFAEKFGAQIISFIISVILARILEIEDYSVVELLAVFLAIANVLVDSGLGNALIQKKDADSLDFSTVLLFNIVWCSFLYILFFVSAPFIADFYNNKNLTSIFRFSGLIILISGVKNVQQAYVARMMQFKKFFFSTLGGTIISGIIGVILAISGYGAWALVAQNVINAFVDTIILSITVRWDFSFKFSLLRLKSLIFYGWKLLIASLLDTIYGNLSALIIGKKYSAADLAYYKKGNCWPSLVIININYAIDSVLLPMMAKEQDEREKVKLLTRKSIQMSSYIIWPMMIGLISVAEPLVRLVLTEKWLPIVPYMCVFALCYAFYPIHTANLNAIKALGRSDLILKLEVIKKIFGIVAIISAMSHGVWTMMIAYAVTNVFSTVVNVWPNRRMIGYRVHELIEDVVPSILLSVIMGICSYSIQKLGLGDVVTIFIQVFVGVVVYVLGSILGRFKIFFQLIGLLKK